MYILYVCMYMCMLKFIGVLLQAYEALERMALTEMQYVAKKKVNLISCM